MGVAYGAYHQSRLSKREVGIRAVEDQQKAIRDAKLAEEKKRSVAGNKTLDTVSNCETNTSMLCFAEENRAIEELSHGKK